MLTANNPISKASVQVRASPNASPRCRDRYPFVLLDLVNCGGRRIYFDHRIRNYTAQATEIAMLAVPTTNQNHYLTAKAPYKFESLLQPVSSQTSRSAHSIPPCLPETYSLHRSETPYTPRDAQVAGCAPIRDVDHCQ